MVTIFVCLFYYQLCLSLLLFLSLSVSYSCVGVLLSGKRLSLNSLKKDSRHTHSLTHALKDKEKYYYFQVAASQGSIYHHQKHYKMIHTQQQAFRPNISHCPPTIAISHSGGGKRQFTYNVIFIYALVRPHT